MRAWLLVLFIVLFAAVASARSPRLVWVTTIHRGGNVVTIGRTYTTRARALREASLTTDADVWIMIHPSELMRGNQ